MRRVGYTEIIFFPGICQYLMTRPGNNPNRLTKRDNPPIYKYQVLPAVGHGFLGNCAWVACMTGFGPFVLVQDCVFDSCFLKFWPFIAIILKKNIAG